MKIFKRDYKTNFVDDNNRFVGYDSYHQCCEDAGYMITKKFPEDLDQDETYQTNLDGYQFDPDFGSNGHKDFYHNDMDAGAGVVFRLLHKKKRERFLTLYNCHNGYYSHGFEFGENDNIVYNGSL